MHQDDVVQLVELMSEIAIHPGDHLAKKRLLLERLMRLLRAERWSWSLNSFDATGKPRHTSALQGGFTPDQAAALSETCHHPVSNRTFTPTFVRIFKERRPITVRLEDHPEYPLWRQSEASVLAAKAGIGTFMSSTCAVGESMSSSVTLFRPPGRPPFSDRERDQLHVVMRGVAWLHTEGWPEGSSVERTVALTASHMVVLSLLVKGYSRTEIAESRHLSVNTINTYTQRIFSHFNVRSQPELMRRFLHGEEHTVEPEATGVS